MDHSIPSKANRVLNLIILGFLLILIRVWYLSIAQHDEHVQQARKPQRRSVIEKVERATIRDRFNIPLAINKIQYNVSICYADIRQIPSIKWERPKGIKPKKVYARALYIKELSTLLGKELDMEPQTIEDTIHGKASLFPHTPFIIKEAISEELYYRFKMLEKDWVGIRTEKGSSRYYPQGKIGSDVIGYMGSIGSKEYLTIAQEIKELHSYISDREAGEMPFLPKGFHNPLEVRERLRQLQEKAYTINDLVGKSGIENSFDEELRGYFGKRTEEIDVKGNFLRELPGHRKAISGQRLLLSISSELQEFAEQLLTQNEEIRQVYEADSSSSLKEPWIRGGAIVVFEPKSGEVLTLASYPRFDPNDFIPSKSKHKQKELLRWLENESYVGEVWDGKRALERERFNTDSGQFYDEKLNLSWLHYLEAILPENSQVLNTILKVSDIQSAYALQKKLETLLQASNQLDMRVLIDALYETEGHTPSLSNIPLEKKQEASLYLQNACDLAKHSVNTYLQDIPHNDDKLLTLDLCRMMIHTDLFSLDILEHVGKSSLAAYHSVRQSVISLENLLISHVQDWFHKLDFQQWRDTHFKDFLKVKRQQELEKKEYTRPYTDYLERLEKMSFKEFWQRHRCYLLEAFILGSEAGTHPEMTALEPYFSRIRKLRALETNSQEHIAKASAAFKALPTSLYLPYLKTMRSFEELTRPLLGKYRSLRNTKGVQLEKHLAAAFYPLSGFGFGRSQAFRQSTPLGSVFKVVVAYQALLERYQYCQAHHQSLYNLNPLTLVDNIQKHAQAGSNQQILGYTLDGAPITRLYKGGRLPRSHPNIGKIDLIGALEQSSNLYFAILAGEYIQNPANLIEATRLFGFGERSGIELPGEITGTIPNDVDHNRTGLYSFAMGQHSLVVTPLQTAVMLAAVANKGHVLKPKIVQIIAGNEPSHDYKDPFETTSFPFQDNLNLIGISFSLFTETQNDANQSHVWYSSAEDKHSLFIPDEIYKPLAQGLHQVISGQRGTARPNIIRLLNQDPALKRNFLGLKDQLIGKTGTAEILFKQTIDAASTAEIHNHIWFAGISFPPSDEGAFTDPELVVVVYLRFSEAGGKEAAPLAAEIVKKWREICAKYGRSAYILPNEF